jgi:hypothetical protein
MRPAWAVAWPAVIYGVLSYAINQEKKESVT